MKLWIIQGEQEEDGDAIIKRLDIMNGLPMDNNLQYIVISSKSKNK